MTTCLFSKKVAIGCFVIFLMTGCTIFEQATLTAEPTASLVSPTNTPEPTSCEEVEGNCILLIFDGENCMYKGPAIQEEGPVTLLFINNGDYLARVNLMRHQGEETIQDMIDYLGEEPSTKHTPTWAAALGPWVPVRSGERHTSEEILKPGIHTMVCADGRYGWWLGGGFTVEE
ncbi:MAG: hypothetical protein JRF62_17630 [Deltaproteobacteria bacterium]|nr:hypothetical protein [Deltaproteobacteria bacterium]